MPEQPTSLPSADELFGEWPCGLLLTNHDGMILTVNRTFCVWTGQSAEDLVGKKTLSELLTMGGRIFHQTHWLPMLQMQGSLAEVKLDVKHFAGHTVPMMLNAVRRQAPGGGYDQVSFTVAEERNKYERELLAARKRADLLASNERDAQKVLREAQARLRQALNGGALFVWGVDPATGRRTYADDVALLLGHPQAQPVGEGEVLGAIPAHQREAEAAALAAALRFGGAPYAWRYELQGADGQRRIVAASGQAFFNEDGSPSQFVGILQDVTLSETQREAAEDRALFAEQMVGIVSHDLRNPLSAILIGSKLLSGDMPIPPEKRARLWGNVERSVQRAQRMIAELLDFTVARVGTGISVTKQSIKLERFVAEIVDELALAFPGRELEHRHIGDEGECSAAPDRLAQLVGNLVGNAMAYGSCAGPVTVTSRLEGDRASVSVRNFGEPIAASLIGSLFEPMVRGDTGNNGLRSVGLGLFIVRAIALAHSGDVVVTSTAELGTEFTFTFSRH
jgi:sigma-B regulation protein RsbU (phosphoserine phosphatase)